MQKKQIQVRTLAAPLRPLNNVTSAAIAVEVAPPGSDVRDLTLAAYQQSGKRRCQRDCRRPRQVGDAAMIPRHLMIGVGVLLVAVLGMAIYAGRMRGRVAQVASAAADTRPVAPPVSGPTEKVTCSCERRYGNVARASR